jgi:hypothetical protein
MLGWPLDTTLCMDFHVEVAGLRGQTKTVPHKKQCKMLITSALPPHHGHRLPLGWATEPTDPAAATAPPRTCMEDEHRDEGTFYSV